MKKILYTLNICDYAPEITEITLPLLRRYADKIGAHFYVISTREFPDMPVTYEKFQIYKLSKLHANDWSIFLDIDTLVHRCV